MDITEYAPYLSRKYIKQFKEYYPDMELMYKENPYSLLDVPQEFEEAPTFEDIDKTVTLKTFDLRLKELRAVIKYVLKQNEQAGNSWIEKDTLEKNIRKILRKGGHPILNNMLLNSGLNYYSKTGMITIDKKRDTVCLTETRNKEFRIYNGIKSMKKNNVDFSKYEPVDVTNILSKEQLESAYNVVTCGENISLLTGGPGTGKTTVTKSIVKGINRAYPEKKVVLLAPTGKAAKRIQEVFEGQDIEIETIHLFVGWGFEECKMYKVIQNIQDTDVIIIDETSMVSVDVLSRLFEYINTAKTKLIFIGDSDQLPAVGTGDLINDLKTMGVYEEHLYINYRSDDAIISNATRLKQGDFHLQTGDTFEFIDINSCIAKELLSKEMAYGEDNEITLTPYRKLSVNGNVIELNHLIHNEKYGDRRRDFLNGYCLGERVIFTKTNYKRKYFNGDTGTLDGVCTVKVNKQTVDAYRVTLSDGRVVKVTDENDFELAYAITIHKSQGSEYDIVNIYIPEYSSFITREMLYTAITRAKAKVRLWTTIDIYKRICLTKTVKRKTLINLWNEEKIA